MSTNANNTVNIEWVHKQIHEGEMFEVSRKEASLATSSSIIFSITGQAGAKPQHLTIMGSCGGDFRLALFEAPTITGAGTAQTPVNMNRLSSNTSLSNVYLNPTVSGEGTKIFDIIVPGGSGGVSNGATSRQGQERILDPTKTYIVILTNLAATAKVAGLLLDWYEEDLT